MKGYTMNDVIDFVENLVRTKPEDLERRLGEISEDMLRQLTKNIVINYQNLKDISKSYKRENSKLRYYTEKLENLLLRNVGPGAIKDARK